MSDVTHTLTAIEQSDAKASEELLPLVDNELRRMAAHKMSAQPAEWNQRLGTGKLIDAPETAFI